MENISLMFRSKDLTVPMSLDFRLVEAEPSKWSRSSSAHSGSLCGGPGCSWNRDWYGRHASRCLGDS